MRLAGLVLAAGRSRRMGVLKQTLPWPCESDSAASAGASGIAHSAFGHSTIVASAFDAIAPFCERMHVVVGRDAEAVAGALGEREFTQIDADSDGEMLASICNGLAAVMRTSSPILDAIMLQPGDHPSVSQETVRLLFAEHAVDPTRAIMPEYRGKGGHPALIPVPLARQIIKWSDSRKSRSGGLRQFWIDHANLRKRIAVDDALCTRDLDTSAEYEAALTMRKRGSSEF